MSKKYLFYIKYLEDKQGRIITASVYKEIRAKDRNKAIKLIHKFYRCEYSYPFISKNLILLEDCS